MSSDSEDDCYGNIAQKLQSIRSKFKEDKIETPNFVEESFQTVSSSKKVDKVIEIDYCDRKDNEPSKNDSDDEEISLDAIIAKNSKKRQTRNSKRNADISADNILPSRDRKRSRASSKKSNAAIPEKPASDLSTTDQSANANTPNPVKTSSVNTPRGSARGRRRGRRGRGASNAGANINTTVSTTITSVTTTTTVSNRSTTLSNITSTTAINTPEASDDSDIGSILNLTQNNPRRDCRGRGRQRTARRQRMWLPDIFPVLNLGASNNQQTSYPTYSIGNTEEYPDECYNQPLFTTQNKKHEEVIVVGENEPENDSIDENEELSVKVDWQNCEVIKFPIRRFQKFTQIFDFFANRENVNHDKLFFTYNDKILKKDDTPDSITYNIVKFIDGGIVNQSMSKIFKKDCTAKGGITLKFQCQNVKKPFEMTIQPNDKLSVVFMMCAEHLEKPLDKLKFHFDGDVVKGKNTPRELELEGGECIDVTIAS